MARFRYKSCITFIALALLLLIITIILKSLEPDDSRLENKASLWSIPYLERLGMGDPRGPLVNTANVMSYLAAVKAYPKPNYHLHAFYYTWYRSREYDGKYVHWDHPLLPHWDPRVAQKYPTGRHNPPDDIGANFYPALGPYSSRDPVVVEAHMRQLRTAAIGVLALSWYPPGMGDDNGMPTDDIVPLLLDVAQKYDLKVAFHIEPYKGRDERSMFKNVKYIVEKYGGHPAFFRFRSSTGKLLPLFYVYDSYLLSPDKWAKLLGTAGSLSIRGTPYDGIFMALLVEEKHKGDIVASAFDGIYTYFATTEFSYGSSYRNWKSIKAFCDDNKLLFIPSVGPGYIDTSVRPWNSHNIRHRNYGRYYETALSAAMATRPAIISITSFNEWHEGTQIEMAVPKTRNKTIYLNYLPEKPVAYLQITRRWAERYSREMEKWSV